MNISPKVEPWLIALLDGVQNSNHGAEVVATEAHAAAALATRLGELIDAVDTGNAEMNSVEIDTGDPDIQPHPWHEEWLHHARAALALAGETP